MLKYGQACSIYINSGKCQEGYRTNLKVNTVARFTEDCLETSLGGFPNL